MSVNIFRSFFTYTNIAIASIAAGGSSSPIIQIQNDADFELQKMTYYCDLNASATESSRAYPQLSLMITDSGSGTQLMNTPVPFGSIMGNGELPFILPQVRVFVRNSNITLSIANFSAATTYYNIYVLLIGRKLFS